MFRYRVFTSQQWKQLTESGKALGAVVPNLQPKTKYEVEVAAMTSVGTGPFTRRSAITTEKPGMLLQLSPQRNRVCCWCNSCNPKNHLNRKNLLLTFLIKTINP